MNTFFHIWKYPMALAALTLFGLLAALMGTGIWHLLSWIALAAPAIAGIWHSLLKTSRQSQ
jgi:hypothetical protein